MMNFLKGRRQIPIPSSVFVVQLQSSTKINSIHIGNHGSAFVEVLVSNKAAAASSKQEEDFKVLLLCSSLMTLQESRGEKNMKG